MSGLTGKTALVTGAGSGIGLAAAQALAARGVYVFLVGRRREALEQAVAVIGQDRAGVIQADVTSQSDLDAVASTVRASGRGLDILFANAGLAEMAPIGGLTWEHVSRTFTTNVGGAAFTLQTVLPLLRSGASVILCGSSGDVKAAPGLGMMAASKAALRSLARTWAAELVDRSIRVNVIAPGITDTPGMDALLAGAGGSLSALASTVPMKRFARPEEIGDVIAFLASDASSFMTGAELYVDGGDSQL